MANPQTENGYLRIANEIWDEILRRKFTGRQQNILLLIIRLSYGCGKKSAIIPKLNYFELCGVRIQDVKNELKFLCQCRVIYWDQNTNNFWFNKDYEEWQKDPVRGWDEEKFSKLLRINLVTTESVNELQKTEQSYEKCNLLTEKSNVTELRKVSIEEGENPCGSKAEGVSKDIIKDINNNNKNNKEDLTPESYQKFINTLNTDRARKFKDLNNFYESNGFGKMSPNITQALGEIIDSGKFDEPEEIIMIAIREGDFSGKQYWRYIETALADWESKNYRTVSDVETYLKSGKNKPSEKQKSRDAPRHPVPNSDETEDFIKKYG